MLDKRLFRIEKKPSVDFRFAIRKADRCNHTKRTAVGGPVALQPKACLDSHSHFNRALRLRCGMSDQQSIAQRSLADPPGNQFDVTGYRYRSDSRIARRFGV